MSSTKQVAIPNIVLQSSFSMPVIGFGTAALTDDGDVHKQAVIEAIKLGYRHFDTASIYGSEQALGEAIAEALKLGLISSRDELFITSKLWLSDNHPDLVLPALRKSLQNLGLEYLDLYLIHWPLSAKPGLFKASYDDENDLVPFDLKGVWTSMEQCHKLGLAKSIGVSNFSIKKLQHVLSFATIPPAVNQVGMNASWQQKNLTEYCKSKGIIVTAYSPLGARGTFWDSNDVMGSELLKDVAQAHGKTVAQVSLRWLYEQDVTFAVKSYNKERMKENLEIFDFSLTNDDYQKINQIKQTRKGSNGPTTLVIVDLFDGEN
ncbi:hypothetical protein HN51_049170 [Arachis hypogaea]|uniref:NADP-dependent oxidoreductase domain-containing protein n=2 Tax=Arachis TaxID=3817 RepID=A0A444YFU3_ARAHY|nr:NAD(P)H-dependent 6'-deoxychalcone synthase [Arachis ipaensis]XP_025665388.1 NAD(P)H-dependent 6'-deoxychalcone synthase-like [Arachis hypogaea]RYR00788.1 hypothetical protein Ahy_B07g088908 [Arachis hypogaea]